MEITQIAHDIKLLSLEAKSFPEGIMAAFDHLRAKIPGSEVRTCYGISRPEKGKISYWAGVEELYPGEAEILQCEIMILKKGLYVGAVIQNFMEDPVEIGCTFQKLLTEPALDPNGYCVEWYFNETDVKCMIRKQDLNYI
jgi:hypothetical protein